MKNSRPKRSQSRRTSPACETLESRVVLTYGIGSSSLLGSLSYEGVVTSPVVSSTVPILPIRPVLPTPILPFLMSADERGELSVFKAQDRSAGARDGTAKAGGKIGGDDRRPSEPHK